MQQMDSIHRSASALEAFANLTGFKTHPELCSFVCEEEEHNELFYKTRSIQ